MSSVRELHNNAMHFAQLALVARQKGEWEQADILARKAYEYEEQAAILIPEEKISEPTRSILYQSAASLAYQCKEFQIAQRLIAKGLSGYPPAQVERELKDLYEQINFESHLQLRGITLKSERIISSLNKMKERGYESMKKFLFVVVVLLILGGIGEYFYFTTTVNQLQDQMIQQQAVIDAAKQETTHAQAELANMQKDAKTREVLSQELLACQQRTFETEYASWPAFLRPDAKGDIEPVRRWILAGVKDLNSVNVVSYHPPKLSSVDKMWHFDVRVFGKRLNGEYGVNVVHFKFFQDSRFHDVTEEPEW